MLLDGAPSLAGANGSATTVAKAGAATVRGGVRSFEVEDDGGMDNDVYLDAKSRGCKVGGGV